MIWNNKTSLGYLEKLPRGISGSVLMHNLLAVFPTIGVIQVEKKMVQNLLFTLAEGNDDTALVLKGIQGSFSSLARIGRDDRLSPMGQGGVCTIANIYCWIWIKALSQAEKSTQKRKEKVSWLSKVDPDGLWDLFSWLNPGLWWRGRRVWGYCCSQSCCSKSCES